MLWLNKIELQKHKFASYVHPVFSVGQSLVVNTQNYNHTEYNITIPEWPNIYFVLQLFGRNTNETYISLI